MNVSISGVSDASATTDASGRYSFTGLRMGNYSVEISGFDSDAVGFSSTASSTSVGVGESKIVSFDGTYLRTAGVSGQVSVEGEGLNGVMVSLRGGPDNVDESTTTDAAGQYAFASLRAGTYTVGISGWDDTDFEFEVTSKSVTVALGETGYVEFEGELLRTSGLAGRVSVGGMGMAGITVTLSGTAEATANTDASGIYAFAGLAAGDYTVTISGYDAVEYSFDDSQTVTLEMDKTAIVNFDGMALRTASVKVMVTADGEGVAGVTATLTLVTGATSGTILGGGVTDADGMHTFGPLLAGNYRVDISGFDAEIDFADGTNWQGPVATGGMAEANFAGMINRTGSIAGMVTADGEGMGGVTVTLGGAGDASAMTADDGSYSFTGLRRGDYTVSIANPDDAMYSFPTTSRAVSVAIGQMHSDVSFAGTMIRRGSISGQISVEGMGLDSVTVTLSGAHDATTMTDASGQYAFSGLGGGSYTVSFENPNGDAYDFDATSAEVMVGNAEAATQNFSGMHTRTASVSGMLFVDEVDSNDMYDEGEEMLAAADIEVALIGPTIAMRQTANTDAEGNFTFENLRMGTYQLVVGAEGVPADYGYGGPATGYEVEVTAGMGSTQNIPFDITHQTVAFSVMLKSGDMMGDALPGATVTLYADKDGENMVGDGETDDDGMATVRFARADASGDMVYAGVMAPDGFDVAGDMQMVEWASTDKMSAASNSQDVVNLTATFSFAGKTITTDFGGGEALADWAIDVTMMGEDEEMVAVEGTPDMLDDMGMASVMMTAGSAADLPMTYHVALADDQDDDMDGGEHYQTVEMLALTHTGLKVATAMDAGALEARYTTQTLKVYVHQENDQVVGYTGTVLGEDQRMNGFVEVEVRYIAGSGRSRAFEEVDSIKMANPKPGEYVFSNVPADRNVIVTATEEASLGQDSDGNDIANTARILSEGSHADEVHTYMDPEANGIMGGAFGEQGGYSPEVELCPLMSDESAQRHGECSTFAFVQTYAVDGQAWKNVVTKSGDDFATDADGEVIVSTAGHKDLTVSMDPVEGENLAGDDDDYTEKGNKKAFDFGYMASGVYTVTVPDGWVAQRGPADDTTDDLATRLSPLDSALNIDVTPETGYVYGTVLDKQGRPMEGVTVHANGKTGTTDAKGRYIIEGFGPRSTSTQRNRIVVTTAEEGSAETTEDKGFLVNYPVRQDIRISDATEVTVVSGRVTKVGTGDGVSGVQISSSGKILNLNAKSNIELATNDIYVARSDGNYSLRLEATSARETISASKDHMFFTPDEHTVTTTPGGDISGINFNAYDNGTIWGRVVDDGKNALSGVIVSAALASDSDNTAVDTDTTGTLGIYSLSVPHGRYTVTATRPGYGTTTVSGTFSVPNDGKAIDDIPLTAARDDATLSSLTLSGVTFDKEDGKTVKFSPTKENYTATVNNDVSMTTVRPTTAVNGAEYEIDPADADAGATGHQVDLTSRSGTTEIEVTVTSLDESATKTYTVTVTRRNELTTITGTVTDASSGKGISGVRIQVSGADPLNAGTKGLLTGSNGSYKAEVESGGTGEVTASKAGYTFKPPSQTVGLNAGSVPGINFTGSAYATITGRVVDSDGNGLEGVKVTGGGDEDDTDRRGDFSLNVPAGSVKIQATKAGYDFEPLTVFVTAGQKLDIGEITVTGNATPINVTADRDVDDGSFDGMVTVTWAAGPGGRVDSYQVESCVDPCDESTNDWTDFGSAVNDAGADLGVTASVSGDGKIHFRVMATDFGPDEAAGGDDDVTHTSATVPVEAIDPTPTDFKAKRITAGTDRLEGSWTTIGNATTQMRVVVELTAGAGSAAETHWYVLASTVDRTYADTVGNRWSFTLPTDFTSLTRADEEPGNPDSNSANPSTDIYKIRVEARQGADGEWNSADAVEIK